MRAKKIVRQAGVYTAFIVYISLFLMALSAGCFAQAQTIVASQNAEPSQTSGADATAKALEWSSGYFGPTSVGVAHTYRAISRAGCCGHQAQLIPGGSAR